MALVKICGIKTLDEASAVCALDVDFIGLIFAKSKRRVELNLARQIARFAHSKGKKVVGVFAEQSDCEIMEICQFVGLDVAQVHGVVSENLHANLKDMGQEIWQVFSVKDSLPEVDFKHFEMALFDCKGENAGGNGTSFEWEILKEVKFKFGMAGGIGEHNIKEALKFKPYLVDINSKVEDENGIKDAKKIERILKIIGEVKDEY